MPDYINPNAFTVHLTGPDGIVIKVQPHAKITLPDYFDRYRARGFIKLTSNSDSNQSRVVVKKTTQSKIHINRTALRKQHQHSIEAQKDIQQNIPIKDDRKARRQEIAKAKKISRNTPRQATVVRHPISSAKMIVGRRLIADATELLQSNLKQNHFPISNNIGIGIMSYERIDTLRRLVNSIISNTDLRKTTIFISDDGSTNQELLNYLDELSATNNFVILKNKERIGIAGNSNRLIRCITRFEYGMILNDDVEVLRNDWEYYYTDAMRHTGMHHFLYRQIGIYNATIGDKVLKNSINLYKVDEKPHGAVMAFTREMLVKCGYFNESYGMYGMEHVDWSQKVWEMGLQEPGFFDVEGSDQFFRINGEKSAVSDKDACLKQARILFKNRSKDRIGPTEKSKVPEITYVVPFRDLERNESIITVINNIRAQRFPVIHTIMVEQDTRTRINVQDFAPVSYYLIDNIKSPLFNKSTAFNLGVQKTTTSSVILHDADMLTQSNYTKRIWDALESSESCHLGGKVIYADENSTRKINSTKLVDHEIQCERIVGYFEGGSLACHVSSYWKCGAFNEDYCGWGCEDCDFYARLAGYTKWLEDRSFDFLHLWHTRASGWDMDGRRNKDMETALRARLISERVQLQYQQLRTTGYQKELDEAIG
tara:strand:- start:577 stop:2538 length:1962 start_codon:yes stop_codon:yes gene_type:complete